MATVRSIDPPIEPADDGSITAKEMDKHLKNIMESHDLADAKSIDMPFELEDLLDDLPEKTWPWWTCPDGERSLSWRRVKHCFRGIGNCNFLSCVDQPIYIYHPEMMGKSADGKRYGDRSIMTLPTQVDDSETMTEKNGDFESANKGLQAMRKKTKGMRVAWDIFMLTMNIAVLTISIITITELSSMVMLPFSFVLVIVWLLSLIADIQS
jgi:hypothetical protein